MAKNSDVFNEIVTDYRLIAFERRGESSNLYLVSNRAGNGRMYYTQINSGLLFCSDLRFLLKIIPLKVNDPGLFAILKYGAIPEPLTIAENISAVPAAHYLHFRLPENEWETRSYFQLEFPYDTNRQNGDLDAYIKPAKEILYKSAEFLAQYKPAILISGGIDSSLYAVYLNKASQERLHGINCIFGDDDPEFIFARELAEKINAHFHIGRMHKESALTILDDIVRLTGHPFSDFSSIPIVFILKFMQENIPAARMLIEGNGGDDCFGFPDLTTQSKLRLKSKFPKILKDTIALLFRNSPSWKWELHNRFLGRILALADVHELNPKNYFLALTPVNFLGLNVYRDWDRQITQVMEDGFARFSKKDYLMSYEAETTVRQLMHVNSRRWAAKAYSVSENLGIRIIYPYIWRDVLIQQGTIPWQAKVNNGVVKWPLKRLLEEYMPEDFIYRKKSGFVPPFAQWLTSADFNRVAREVLLTTDSNITRIVPSRIIADLLSNALKGKTLRHAILNFLWGALFTEMWIKENLHV